MLCVALLRVLRYPLTFPWRCLAEGDQELDLEISDGVSHTMNGGLCPKSEDPFPAAPLFKDVGQQCEMQESPLDPSLPRTGAPNSSIRGSSPLHSPDVVRSLDASLPVRLFEGAADEILCDRHIATAHPLHPRPHGSKAKRPNSTERRIQSKDKENRVMASTDANPQKVITNCLQRQNSAKGGLVDGARVPERRRLSEGARPKDGGVRKPRLICESSKGRRASDVTHLASCTQTGQNSVRTSSANAAGRTPCGVLTTPRRQDSSLRSSTSAAGRTPGGVHNTPWSRESSLRSTSVAGRTPGGVLSTPRTRESSFRSSTPSLSQSVSSVQKRWR